MVLNSAAPEPVASASPGNFLEQILRLLRTTPPEILWAGPSNLSMKSLQGSVDACSYLKTTSLPT